MPSKSKGTKGFDVESLVSLLSMLLALAQNGGLNKLLVLLGGLGTTQPKSSKTKHKKKVTKPRATRAGATARRTPESDSTSDRAGKSWAEVLKQDTKEEWILDTQQWSVPIVDASALASGSSGVCLTSQSQAKDIVASGRKNVPAAIITHKKTPVSEPAMLTLVKKNAETESVLRKMHITQIGQGKTYPKSYKAEAKGRNQLVILECHHDLSTAAYLKQLQDGPREAWQLWLKSKGLVEGDLPELTSTRTSTYKGRTMTSTAGFLPTDKLGGLLKHSGNDGVFIRVPKDVEASTHQVIWLEGNLEQAWQSVATVTEHRGMIRPASGKYGLRVESTKMDAVKAQLPEELKKGLNRKPITVAGLDPTLTRNQVVEEVKKLFRHDIEPNYSYMRYGVKHWTAWTVANVEYTKTQTELGTVVLTEGLITHKSAPDAPPGLGKSKRELRRTATDEAAESERASRRRQ
eukprot:6491652-Amphidinium_carterae.1